MFIERTRILKGPDDQVFAANNTFTFDCLAVTDPSTPIVYRWYHNDELIGSMHVGNGVWISDNGSLHVTTQDEDMASSVIGRYRCNVTNGYSHAQASAFLYRFASGMFYINFTYCAITIILNNNIY